MLIIIKTLKLKVKERLNAFGYESTAFQLQTFRIKNVFGDELKKETSSGLKFHPQTLCLWDTCKHLACLSKARSHNGKGSDCEYELHNTDYAHELRKQQEG